MMNDDARCKEAVLFRDLGDKPVAPDETVPVGAIGAFEGCAELPYEQDEDEEEEEADEEGLEGRYGAGAGEYYAAAFFGQGGLFPLELVGQLFGLFVCFLSVERVCVCGVWLTVERPASYTLLTDLTWECISGRRSSRVERESIESFISLLMYGICR